MGLRGRRTIVHIHTHTRYKWIIILYDQEIFVVRKENKCIKAQTDVHTKHIFHILLLFVA